MTEPPIETSIGYLPSCAGTSYTDKAGVTIAPKRRMVLMRSLARKQTKGGIVIPDIAQESSDVGPHELQVLAHGPGEWSDGIWLPIDVKVGDCVLLHAKRQTFGGEALQLVNEEGDREKYYLIDEDFLCAGITRAKVEPSRILTPDTTVTVPQLRLKKGGKR